MAEAARTAEGARAAADRSRAELSAAEAACEDAATRSARVAALRAQVPEQNSGHPQWLPAGTAALRAASREADVGTPDELADQADEALLDTVTAARTAWDAAPCRSPLSGPSAARLRDELAGLPEGGVDAQVQSLAEAHRAALAAAADQPERAAPAPRPSPRPAPEPGELRRIADLLDAPPSPRAHIANPDVAELGAAVQTARTRQRAATAAAETAEREAAAAEEHYQQLRASAAAADARRTRNRSGGRLRTLTLTILAVGVGLAALYFGLLAALVVSAVVILPVVVSLLAVVVIAVRAMKRATTGRRETGGRPVVDDLVGAVVAVREKRAAAVRAREEAQAADQEAAECRARHVAALRGERPDPVREQAVAWCGRHGLRADADALRALARRTEDQAALRDAERTRLGAAVAGTGDALRAALRERGILDEGSPVEQFARYEAQALAAAQAQAGWRPEVERALAARVAAEEAAEHAEAARRAAVAQLRTAAGAVGLDTAGDPEALVQALDAWRAARTQRAAVAVIGRPRVEPRANGNGNGSAYGNGYGNRYGNGAADTGAELAALLGGGSPADLRRQEDDLRAVRDERLTRAWRADLEACEARRRRDELATAAGVDPVRAGDRAFVAALVEAARHEEEQARAAVARHGTARMPAEAPLVARTDEEVDAAEAHLRRLEQLRRTTALTRRFLARAQEQTHRDIAPVLAATLREWLPG